ncbi:hypothetical protein [Flavobacterium piscisymbiosum]|uniref:Carboxypeptidase regulatory-like domain-containing protein n=1 Tax=Flavobacterium piscisymbiosum TaxID=2893753 RepID=A0ABS8MJU9_9FLAO|nr:hypothetical protein [Flavobacterium sp. F-30]MCC9065766.1 hypothetical protein [Flavobacterium sp. F-30]
MRGKSIEGSLVIKLAFLKNKTASLVKQLLYVMSLLPFVAFGQKTIAPGSKDINTKYIKHEKSIYTVYYVKDTSWTKQGTLTYDIVAENNQLSLTNSYTPKDNSRTSVRTSVADPQTLKPISYTSDGKETKLNLNFAETITGNYYSKKTKKDKKLKLHPKEPYIDWNWTDHLIGTLPLDVGYKARIPQFYYNDESDVLVEYYSIKEVKSFIYNSPRTGKHETWLVTVSEESTGAIYNYIVDKKDHRLWQREMSMGKGMWEITVNEELDYQPIKNKFNKEEAAQQISKGSSVIIGTAYARSDSGKKLGGLVNTAKKQYAPKGTEITLFPSSAYYEEWVEVNKKIRKQKKMPEVPLNADFGYSVKKAKVYDDQGHFEFSDLMPATYVVMATFDFSNSYNYSYVSGYTNYYNYWGYTGSSTNYGTARQSYIDKASIEKRVTIDKDGEKKEVNLKEM